eukprot:11465767-Ditylum_brightwellii.AAC.2
MNESNNYLQGNNNTNLVQTQTQNQPLNENKGSNERYKELDNKFQSELTKMREEMRQEMKTLKEDMEARKMMKEDITEIRAMFSSVMAKLDNVHVHGQNQPVTPQKPTQFQLQYT